MAVATVFLQLLAVATYAAAAATRKSLVAPAQSSSADISFLRMSCGATEHPDTCYNLLLPNVSSFHGSLARIARTATTIAVAKQHRFAEELAILKLHSTGAGRVADMTLVNCYDTVLGSDMYANKTLRFLDNLVLGLKSKRDFSSEKYEAIMWLGSSSTGMMQCIDWLHDAGEEALSKQIVKQVITGCNDVSPYMDMALNLVNAIKF